MKIKLSSSRLIDKTVSSSDLVLEITKNRGITGKIDEFISPQHPKNFKPVDFGLKAAEINRVVKRLQKAKANNETILIYGDYDVDGITSTALLWNSLYQNGFNVTPFVPHREKDGYGVKASSFFRLEEERSQNFNLLITVDNGIVASPELKKIRASGTEIIVIDHHVSDQPIDDIVSGLIHSTLVSGCTLAWVVAKEFAADADLGLAALGAVADCMSLVGVNRSIVVHGLRELRLNPSPGIKKLIELSNLEQDSLSAFDLGFVIGPRINAIGRLSDPTNALRLLCSSTPELASKYAKNLNDYNKDRQSLQQESLDLTTQLLSDKLSSDKLIFVSNANFHPGIIGLLAGRLTEKYYLPSIVISQNGGISKGSCRSIPELDITQTLRAHSKLFVDLGGHSQAAGFSIKNENIPKLQKVITKTINKLLKNQILEPSITVDAPMKLNAVTLKNIKAINSLEPFGIGNPQPLFMFENVKVISKRLLGKDQNHLKLKVDDPETKFPENLAADAIAFKKGELDQKIRVGDLIDIVASLDLNTWNGVTTAQLIVKEIILKIEVGNL